MDRCVQCGTAGLRPSTETHEIHVGTNVIAGKVEAQLCPRCGETYVAGDALERLELMVAALLAKSGHADAASFRFMRHAVGIQAKDLAVLLDVAPETISRWEKGQRDVDKLAWLALAMLVLDRVAGRHDTQRALEATRNPAPLPRTVKLAS